MYIRTNKPKNKIVLTISTLIIVFTIITLCVQVNSKHNIINKLIIAGRNIGENEATATIGKFEQKITQIDWIEDLEYKALGDVMSRPTIDYGAYSDSRTILMYGIPAGRNIIYYIPETSGTYQVQTFGISFRILFENNIISAGMLLRVNKVGDTLQGYMLSFNNNGYGWECDCEPDFSNVSWYDECGGKNVALWKFSCPINNEIDEETLKERWNNGDYSNGIQKTLVKALDYDFSFSAWINQFRENYLITATPSQIIIQDANYADDPTSAINSDADGDGTLYQNITKIDISSDNEIGEGFGFFVNTYCHDCDTGSAASFGINLLNYYLTEVTI